jgi:hypothetical protein
VSVNLIRPTGEACGTAAPRELLLTLQFGEILKKLSFRGTLRAEESLFS